MIEPFNRLCEALEKDFTVRYNAVFDAFKLAAGDVATSLGADVAQISSILDQFKQKYTGIVQTSKDKANSILEKLTSGDLSTEERAKLSTEFSKELEKISAYGNVEKSENQYVYEQKRDSLGRMSMGGNQTQAIKNLEELAGYSNAYITELSDAMKNVNLQYENLRGTLETAYKMGDISKDEYESFSAAMNMAQAVTVKSIKDKIDAQVADMKSVRDKLLEQVDSAIKAGVSEKLNDSGAWFSLEALSGVFGGDTYYAFYNTLEKEYAGLIDKINALPGSATPATWKIPVEVQYYLDNPEAFKDIPLVTGKTSGSTYPTNPNEMHPGHGGGPDAHALGGIMTHPHLGLVAEDGAEAIIPLSGKRRERGLALWQEAGRMLGVREYAEGGIAGAVPVSSGGGSGGNVVIEVGGVQVELGGISFQIDGSENPDEIIDVIRGNISGITDEIASELAEKLQAVFANMPLKTSRMGA